MKAKRKKRDIMVTKVPQYKIKQVKITDMKTEITDTVIEGYFYSEVHDIHGRQICEGDYVAVCNKDTQEPSLSTLYEVKRDIKNGQVIFFIECKAGVTFFENIDPSKQLLVVTSIVDLMTLHKKRERQKEEAGNS